MVLRRHLGRVALAALLWIPATLCANPPARWRPTLRKPADPAPEGWKVVAEHGSLIVDVGGDALTAVMVDRNGQVRDTFTLRRREAR